MSKFVTLIQDKLLWQKRDEKQRVVSRTTGLHKGVQHSTVCDHGARQDLGAGGRVVCVGRGGSWQGLRRAPRALLGLTAAPLVCAVMPHIPPLCFLPRVCAHGWPVCVRMVS